MEHEDFDKVRRTLREMDCVDVEVAISLVDLMEEMSNDFNDVIGRFRINADGWQRLYRQAQERVVELEVKITRAQV